MIHSPMPGICLPSHVPAGIAVEPPVDEHAEARLAPPLHARVFLRRGFGVLDGRDGMRVRGVVMFSLHLSQSWQRARKSTCPWQ